MSSLTKIVAQPVKTDEYEGSSLTLYTKGKQPLRTFALGFTAADAKVIEKAVKDGQEVYADVLYRKGKKPLLRGFDSDTGPIWSRFANDDDVIVINF